MRHLYASISALLLLSSLSFSQSFNLDIEHVFGSQADPTPDGAATGQVGVWNALRFDGSGLPSTPLVDLGGTLVPGVTAISAQGASPKPSSTCSGWGPAEEAEYDGILAGQALFQLRVRGLRAGNYRVYTYAHHDSPASSWVVVVPAPGLPARLMLAAGCPSSGMHAQTDTYVVHESVLQSGDVMIISLEHLIKSPYALSAVQIVYEGPPESVGTNYCTAVPNSTGAAASISATATANLQGEAVLFANNLILTAIDVPAGQPGIFFYGPNQTQVPFGNGNLCVTGTTGRLPVVYADATGTMVHNLDTSAPPSAATEITVGSTWNFQAWFRDPSAGGSVDNFSDGLQVTFGF
jgi:hypothetical protein